MRPRLLYLCDFLPGSNSGGALVVERHLRRLIQEGWEVTLTAPSAVKIHGNLEMFTTRPLPRRRLWWPPAHARWPSSLRLRARLWARAVVRDPNWRKPPDAVLTVLWGYAALTAALAAAAWRAPLAVIVHDLFREKNLSPAEARSTQRLEREVLARAARVWPVSEEMRAVLSPLVSTGAISTLPPVPDDAAAPAEGWQPRFRHRPIIAHAGMLHSYHVPYLAALAQSAAKIGGLLLVVAPAENSALMQLRDQGVAFRHQPSFSSSSEALKFLAAEASALTIMYPFDPAAYRHSPTGFPSRLLEFSHLGLPIVLAAPPGNPLHAWAVRHGWPLLLDQPDWQTLNVLVGQLADEQTWQARSAQMRTLADTVCAPEKIHRQFLAELPRLAISP